MALIFPADTFMRLRNIQCWGFELLNDGYLQQAETTDRFRRRTGETPTIRALKVQDKNEIRHSDQISSRRKNCRSVRPGGTCDAGNMASCRVSVGILASLVWHAVKAVSFQTQISRTKHGYYTEDPPPRGQLYPVSSIWGSSRFNQTTAAVNSVLVRAAPVKVLLSPVSPSPLSLLFDRGPNRMQGKNAAPTE